MGGPRIHFAKRLRSKTRVSRQRDCVSTLCLLPSKLCLLVAALMAFPISGNPTPTTRVPTIGARPEVTEPASDSTRPTPRAGQVFVYMSRLYDRMKQLDDKGCFDSQISSHGSSTETIAGVYRREGSNESPWLNFHTSQAVNAGDNVTLAQVAIVTRPGRRRHSCVHLQTTESRQPECTREPLDTARLTTYDVTPELRARQNENEFSVFLEHLHHAHVQSALLVIFKNVDVEQLFAGECSSAQVDSADQPQTDGTPTALRQTMRAARLKREARGLRHVLGSEEFSGKSISPSLPAAGDVKIAGAFVKKDGGWNKRSSRRERRSESEEAQDDVHMRYERYLAIRRRGQGRKRGTPIPDLDLDLLSDRLNAVKPRHKRHANSTASNGSDSDSDSNRCQKHRFHLDPLDDLHFMDLLAPMYFDLYMCSGNCPPFRVGEGGRGNYHSYLTRLFVSIHPDRAAAHVPPLSLLRCAPLTYSPISVMFVQGEDAIFTQRWHNARVESCGCGCEERGRVTSK